MIEMWNKRYAQSDYVYGKEPNQFFKEHLAFLKTGKALFPAEGEGRNAVYASKMGWEVVAFDNSIEAKKKALLLAEEYQIKIKYLENAIEDFDSEHDSFDLIVLIYVHMQNRMQNHRHLLKFLKPGGTILLEGFSKNQINNTTGGPKNLDMLFSKEELDKDFTELSKINIWEGDIFIDEGVHHTGESSVIRLIGTK
jgi:SAM-dependent methyltransferase